MSHRALYYLCVVVSAFMAVALIGFLVFFPNTRSVPFVVAQGLPIILLMYLSKKRWGYRRPPK